ncbi:hypothetical protein [Blastococcus sp. SYSU DS0539]
MSTPPGEPAAAPPRRRRRRALLVPAGILLALVVAVVVAVLREPPVTDRVRETLAVTATWQDDVVVVTGRGLAADQPVDVSARFEGGSGSALVVTDADGRFALAFRPPAGITDDVEVTAASGPERLQETVAVRQQGGAAPELTGGAELLTVPMTGAPREAPPVPASGLPQHVVPADIAADCSTDVTAPLNQWLAGVPDRSEVLFAEQACYRVDGSLVLEGRSDLVIEGNGATFRAGVEVPTRETNRAQWHLNYGRGLVLRDMTLVGMNPAPRFDPDNEFDHNVFIRGSSDVTVENVHGRGAYGDFVAIAHGLDRQTIPTGVRIRNSSAETVGRMGISCVACDGVTVENSVFHGIGYHVFDLEVEDDEWPTRGIRYTGNTIGRHGHAFFSVGTPFQTFDNDVSDIVIADNLVTQPGASRGGECTPEISFVYSKVPVHDVVITGNSLVSHTDAIFVKDATGVVVRDNRATLVGPSCGDPVGIRTVSTPGADVRDNDLNGYN